MTCKFCDHSCQKAGKQKNGVQKFFCAVCKKYQQSVYRNKAWDMGTKPLIAKMVCESVSVRGIARILKIAINTVQADIKRTANVIVKPPIRIQQGNIEVDELRYASGELQLFSVDVVDNFAAKEGMVKDNSVREQMFASITAWLSSELSQKQWCQDQGITYHVFHYWYRKYRDEHAESTDNNSFVRLAVKPEAGASCEVIFADGTKILFREAVPAQYLKSLLF